MCPPAERFALATGPVLDVVEPVAAVATNGQSRGASERADLRSAGVQRWVDQRGLIRLAGFGYRVPIVLAGEPVEAGMTRVVHYSCLWSAVRGRNRVPCLHTSAYYSTCVESADTSSTSRTFSDMTPQVHLYDTAGFATTPIGGASSAGCKTAGVQTGSPLLVRTPQQKRNLNQKLPGGGGSIMAEPSLTALLQERASRQPRRHGVHVHRR